MKYQHILHIDDDEDDLELFCIAVGKISDTVVCSSLSDAALALKKLAARELEPHIIFLDLNMPVMNGQQFLVEIKKHPELKHIPIVILSTSSHDATIKLVKKLGAADFLSKPGNFNRMVEMLHPILQNH